MLISIIRVIILYLVAMIALRLMGKRQIGELQPSELVITFLVSELATIPLQDLNTPLFLSIAPIISLVFCQLIISIISLKNVPFRRFVNGNPCVVIRNGKLDVKVLSELRITVDELLEELRIRSITNVSDVEYALIETNGQLSFVLSPNARPVSVGDTNSVPSEESLPLIIVNDGYIVERNLKILNKDSNWVLLYLKNNEIDISLVFLMTLDIYGNIFVQKKR